MYNIYNCHDFTTWLTFLFAAGHQISVVACDGAKLSKLTRNPKVKSKITPDYMLLEKKRVAVRPIIKCTHRKNFWSDKNVVRIYKRMQWLFTYCTHIVYTEALVYLDYYTVWQGLGCIQNPMGILLQKGLSAYS